MAGIGFSVVEKLVMCKMASHFNCRTAMYPLGGQLINDVLKSLLQKKTFQVLFQFPDIILCQSAVWQEFFQRELGISETKLRIMPSWTATQDLIAIGDARYTSITSSCQDTTVGVRIVYVGWLESYKGVYELTDAFLLLCKAHRKSKLVFVGDGSERSGLESQLKKSLDSDCFEFTGWLGRTELLIEYKKADIFVLPSHNEGIPNAMIEALAAKLPSVLTSVGSIPDYVSHKEHAYVIEPKSAVEILNGLTFYIENSARARFIAESGQSMVVKNFSPSRVIDDLSIVFDELMAKGV